MNLRVPAALVVVIALATAPQAQAQSAPNSAGTTIQNSSQDSGAGGNAAAHATIPRPDRSFATKAAAAGTAEINDAQIALKNSDRQDVKNFALRMVGDHTKAADRLKSIAGDEGITLPTGESSADQKDTNALQKLTGAPFDRRYILGQRKAHKQAVALFSKEAKSGKDDELKSFASQTLPTLQDHLKMISSTPLSENPQTSSAPQ